MEGEKYEIGGKEGKKDKELHKYCGHECVGEVRRGRW